MSNSIATLILAAGASTRMKDKIKQLLPWEDSTLLGHTIKQAKAVSNLCYVVLGANSEIIQKTIPTDVKTIQNPDWANGMGHSIATGVSHITNRKKELKGILILLIDQPLLDATFLMKMKNIFDSGAHRIVATSYGERLGVPAIFDKSLFSQLQELNQDHGAKAIIMKNKNYIAKVEPLGREIDIDTLEKYNQLIEN
ncbi:NTP transferase domain-containing protein [Muricauda sp. JGD-17]|uniref:NTP transferase domain-containing protein n=1 Tax=Flagellimonas ochracea TaxID=2696472 RepID=A0A964T9Z4_9FLAO|nr:nucleotidyltransferase family protein [Allomuricauda ochracea]NAY90949.1 NTP transferase domain-containing protein [Allomuricauda ochracea]